MLAQPLQGFCHVLSPAYHAQPLLKSVACCREQGKMPTLNVFTNVPGNSLDFSDLLKTLSSTVAQQTGKPESYVLISLNFDKPLMFGGSEAPAAYAELLSIGGIGGEKNKTICKAISDILQERLTIAPNRFYLKFTDTARSDFGYNGSTF